MTKKTIAYISPFYYPFMGGSEISLSRVIHGIRKSKKFKVRLFTNLADEKGTILPGKEQKDGFIYKLGSSKGLITIGQKEERYAQVIENAKAQLEHYYKSIDLIYLNTDIYLRKPEDIRFFASLDKPIIVKMIFDRSVKHLAPNKALLKDLCNKNLLRIHCLSSSTVNGCLKLGFRRNHLFLIPNPIDVEKFSRHKKSKNVYKNMLGLNKYKFILLFVGRLAPQKNIEGLIRIFRKLQVVKSGLCLIIIGECNYPNYKPAIRKLKKDSKILDVIWMGKIPNKHINQYLWASDFFILTSKFEGLSNALLEAMSAGLCPILNRGISGVSDFIQNNKNGLLYKWNELPKFCSRFSALDIKTARQYGKIALKTVQKKADISVIIPRHINMYKGLIF